uniref:Uncharacterized protein n=1 Tax=Poecilia reticulata TaxID=8081 RepID=A0A3P9Q3J8_POERE
HKYFCEKAGKELPPPKPNPVLVAFGNVTPSRYVLDVIRKVRSMCWASTAPPSSSSNGRSRAKRT